MDSAPHQSRVLKFGVFEVDLELGELRKSGLRIKLVGQPFEVLRMLLERPQQLVTREELQKHLWPKNTFVDYELGLKKAVNRIREVLGDDAESPRFIETIPRRGYRFIGTIQNGAPAASPQDAAVLGAPTQTTAREPLRKGFLRIPALVLALSAATLALLVGLGWRLGWFRAGLHGQIHSIAVLPLINLSGNPDQEYFADGMTEELISQLAQVSALKVISRTSVMHYKGTKESSPEIARALGADALIEGSIRREGDRVEIAVQLIEGQSDRHLWAREYQQEIHGVLALQGSVASAIAAEVNAKLTPGEQAHLQQARAVDPDAYEAFLKGRYFFERWNADGRRKAVAYFQQAIAKDRGFAAAYSGLADTLAMRSYFGESTGPEERANGIASAQQALTLDSSLAEGHAAVGLALLLDLHLADAERELRSSVSSSPNCSRCHVWFAYYLTFVRRFPDAAQEINKAQALDPVSSLTFVAAGVLRYFARDFDDAMRQYQKAIELDPSNPEAYKNLADVYLEKHNCSEATRLFVRSEELAGQSRNASSLTKAFQISGCPGMLTKQLEFYSDPANPDYYPMYAAANASLLGKNDQAFKFLNQACETRQGIIELTVEPELDNIRSDPRYPDLLRRIGLPIDSATVPTAPNQPR